MNADQANHIKQEITMLANRVIRDTERAVEADARGLDRLAATHRRFAAADSRIAFVFASASRAGEQA